jgi:hypothetical protein
MPLRLCRLIVQLTQYINDIIKFNDVTTATWTKDDVWDASGRVIVLQVVSVLGVSAVTVAGGYEKDN